METCVAINLDLLTQCPAHTHAPRGLCASSGSASQCSGDRRCDLDSTALEAATAQTRLEFPFAVERVGVSEQGFASEPNVWTRGSVAYALSCAHQRPVAPRGPVPRTPRQKTKDLDNSKDAKYLSASQARRVGVLWSMLRNTHVYNMP